MSRDIQTPGPSEQLTSRYGVKGAIALRLDEIIVPVEIIRPVENRGAIGRVASVAAATFMSECSITAITPPDATNFNTRDFQIRVLKAHVTLLTASGVINISRPTVGLNGFTSPLTKSWKQFDRGGLPPAQMSFKNSAAATAATIVDRRNGILNVTLTFNWSNDPFILGAAEVVSGTNDLLIRPNAVNEGIRVVWEWEEGPIPI